MLPVILICALGLVVAIAMGEAACRLMIKGKHDDDAKS